MKIMYKVIVSYIVTSFKIFTAIIYKIYSNIFSVSIQIVIVMQIIIMYFLIMSEFSVFYNFNLLNNWKWVVQRSDFVFQPPLRFYFYHMRSQVAFVVRVIRHRHTNYDLDVVRNFHTVAN